MAFADLRTFDTIVVDIRACATGQARRGLRRCANSRAQGASASWSSIPGLQFDPPGGASSGSFELHVGKSHHSRRCTGADLETGPCLAHAPERDPAKRLGQLGPGAALYLPSVYASEFEEILEMQDPGQPPERSALLYARTDEGEYVYCALALWRQLKKLHPGSVRLLANLLSPTTRS
jgi:hypothetical protein